MRGARSTVERALPRGWARPAALLCVTLAAIAVLRGSAAYAQSRDEAATSAYVQADFRLMRSAVSRIPEAQAAINGVLRAVRADCPRAAGGSPQNAMSTQLSDEVIGAMVMSVVTPGLPLAKPFVRATEHLRWRSPSLTHEVGEYVDHVRTLTRLAPPDPCSDIRAWAASGFQTLPTSTESFDRVFMPAWVAAGDLPPGLARLEDRQTRLLARRAAALEATYLDFEARQVEVWGRIMNALELWP